MMRRWTDPEGHAWPITGHICDRCGLPLIPTVTTPTAHPMCEPEDDPGALERTTTA